MGGSDDQGKTFDDTWSWDGTRWSRLGAGPSIVPNSQMTTLPGGALGSFGGWDGSRASRALYRFDQNQWTTLEATGPGSRMEAMIAYDPIRRRMVLFGGSDAAGVKLHDLWEFDGSAWTRIQPPQH